MLACHYSYNCFVMWRTRDTVSAQTMARHQSRGVRVDRVPIVLNPSKRFDFGGNSKDNNIFPCENSIIFTANCENNSRNFENNSKNGEVNTTKIQTNTFCLTGITP